MHVPEEGFGLGNNFRLARHPAGEAKQNRYSFRTSSC